LSLEILGFGCEQANNTRSHSPMSVDVVRVLMTPADFPGAFSKYTSKALRQWALCDCFDCASTNALAEL
jgi:hypothetical protein